MSGIEATSRVTNRLGLHLRAASALAETARRFKAHITVTTDGGKADARSVIGLMMLGAAQGTKLKLHAEGEDARAALDAIRELIEDRFGED
jgi:phosphocarrier protein